VHCTVLSVVATVCLHINARVAGLSWVGSGSGGLFDTIIRGATSGNLMAPRIDKSTFGLKGARLHVSCTPHPPSLPACLTHSQSLSCCTAFYGTHRVMT
jgi:hypothetical protein